MRQRAAGAPLILTDTPGFRTRIAPPLGHRWRGGTRSTSHSRGLAHRAVVAAGRAFLAHRGGAGGSPPGRARPSAPVSWAGRPAPVATIQLRSSTCRRRDLAAILADSAALLQTPAVAEPTEVGVELSAEASHVVTDIRPVSRPQDIRVRVGRGRSARDPRGGVEAGDVMAVPPAGQPGHGIIASFRRQPARIATMAAALAAYDRHLGLGTARRRS
jgi:hypothetical protein